MNNLPIPHIGVDNDENTRNIINWIIDFINDKGETLLTMSMFERILTEGFIKYKEPVATFSALPTNAEKLEARGVLDENAVYIWNGSAWVKQSQLNVQDVEDLKARMTTVETNVTAIDGRLKTAEGEIDVLQTDVANLKTQPATTSTGGNGVSVKSYGAVGDGVTDDTANLQKAFDVGGDIYVDEGTYKITQTVYINKDNTTITFHPGAKFQWYNPDNTVNWTACIQTGGNAGTSTMQPVANIAEGSTSISVKNIPADLQPMDYIRVSTQEPFSTARTYYYKQEYLKVVSIDRAAGTISLLTPTMFGYNVGTYPLTFEKPKFVKNTKIIGANLESMNGDKTVGIKMKYAFNPLVKECSTRGFRTAGTMFEYTLFPKFLNNFAVVETDVDELDYGMIMYYSMYGVVANNTINSHRTSIDITGSSSFITVIGNSCHKGRLATHNAHHVLFEGNTVHGFMLIRGPHVQVVGNEFHSDVKTVDQGIIQLQEAADQGYIDIKNNKVFSPENNGAMVGINFTCPGTHNINVVGNSIKGVEYGIALNFGNDDQFANHIEIKDNKISLANRGGKVWGIEVQRAGNTNITGNTIVCQDQVGSGIMFYASAYADKFNNHIVSGNKIHNMATGLQFSTSVGKIFATGNMMTSCGQATNEVSFVPPNSLIKDNFAG